MQVGRELKSAALQHGIIQTVQYTAAHKDNQIYGADYRLAPEMKFPTQLDEYSTLIDALQSDFGKARGVHPDRVCGGGDSAGGNMTAAISLRRCDESKKLLAGQVHFSHPLLRSTHELTIIKVLLYPEARLPFDTPAVSENSSGYYLECNGIFSLLITTCPAAHHLVILTSRPEYRASII